MRKLILSFVLVAAGAFGLTVASTASAYDDGRIFVSIGDVSFAYGKPYHRHSRAPLYVVHDSWGPRYYYYAQPVRYYAPAPRYYAPPHYYAPPPRYYGPRTYAHGYRDGYRDRHHHDRYRHDRHDRRDHRGRWRD